MTRRRALISCATCAILIVTVGVVQLLSRPRPIRIRKTLVASATGSRLTSVFDGVAPRSMDDAGRILRSNPPRPLPPCVTAHSEGLIARLLGLIEIKAKAQGGYSTNCSGHYQEPAAPVSCSYPALGCSGNIAYFDSFGRDWSNGWQFNGTSGCTGTGCLYSCNADNGYCNYIACTYTGCSGDSDCPSGQYCFGGGCRGCASDSDCAGGAHGAGKACDTAYGQCVQCTSSNSSACTGQAQYCESALGAQHDTCVACLQNASQGQPGSCVGCGVCRSGNCQDSSEACGNIDGISQWPDGCSAVAGGTCSGGCCVGNDNGGDDDDDDDCYADWNGEYESADGCSCSQSSDCEGGYCTESYDGECGSLDPIVIDLDGSGFALTAAQAGVKFDFFGNGKPLQMPWTAAGSRTGWLALDRTGDGRIESGAELFSNVAPQSGSLAKIKLGFRALAAYDLAANGGNGDGVIDSKDAVFAKLLAWVDSNHNGVSESSELLTMQQAGIQSISLKFSLSKWTDAYGNQFRYRSRIAFAGSVPAGDRYVYDVMLGMGSRPAEVKSPGRKLK